MSDRTTQLVEAALRVFMRYGVGKTTMNDIANEAGVARQTLYNSYGSKEDILRGAVRHVIAKTFKEVTTAWAEVPTLAEKLDLYFEIGPLRWYDIATGSAEGAELLDGIHEVAQEELRIAAREWDALFTDAVRAADGPDPETLGPYINAMSTNAKYNVADRQTLEMRLKVLKQSVLALMGTQK
ncbi:transcriptional regulator, TetR family [Cognatiyoonia koreensis]|uniref:Transcriptional regulator, TetR family n=1 Tax=Cognatiyoonia koreensis TaxID=364200 RepID=A0A1I0QPG3_9RHOB|nr:TetR/AcrR family transcriptional regulator [Cognatiyoonia koreensis]SEW29063.1 transcriptional regulator, TetR family [Cognatiyoonia koreensis]